MFFHSLAPYVNDMVILDTYFLHLIVIQIHNYYFMYFFYVQTIYKSKVNIGGDVLEALLILINLFNIMFIIGNVNVEVNFLG